MTALPADRGAARNDGGGRTTARSVRRARTVARNLRRIEDGELDGGRLARTTANKSFTPQGTGAGPGPQGGLSSLTMLN